MRNLVIAYHVYMYRDKYIPMVAEQLRLLVSSGLYQVCSKLYIGVNTSPNMKPEYGVDWLTTFCNSGFGKDKVEIVFYPTNSQEVDTLKWIREYSEKNPDDYVMYFHTKGISHQTQFTEDWRKYMEYFVIENWQNCIKKLDEGYDCCGVLWEKETVHGYYPHFSGTFWWATTKYINTLNHSFLHITKRRVDQEFWIGTNPNVKAYEFHNSGLNTMKSLSVHKSHYELPYPRYKYALKATTQIKGKICIVTTFDRNYKEAGKTLFNSIYRHTNCNGIDFKVITSDEEVLNELGSENCYFVTDDIKNRYSHVKYCKELPVEKYASSWYRYEIFNMTDYDRVICIDSDCICIDDISYLFSEELNQYDLISVEDHVVSKVFHISTITQNKNFANLSKRMKEGKIDIQPALLVINKSVISNEWYKKLLNYANTASFSYALDEGILNDFIYMENLRIKLLPLEWDYQDLYARLLPQLMIPDKPIIIHCQESKPFKKTKIQINKRLHRWHDLWWDESRPITLIAIVVWNRFENLRLWINAWKQCIQQGAKLIVIHNLETNNDRYSQLCKDNGILYVPRENKGFDIGAFQDVCKERLAGFPNRWENLIWITDDCIPMSKDFVGQFLEYLPNIPCYEISQEVKTHIRTTGFLVTKEISKKLIFPKYPIETKEHCFQFEFRGFLQGVNMYQQIVAMGETPIMVNTDLKLSPLWDAGARGYLNLMKKHEDIFSPVKIAVEQITVEEEYVRKPIEWRKIGHGTLLLNNRYIKPGQTFMATVEEIPTAFRDVVVPLDKL